MSLSLFSGSCVLCKSSIIFRISLSSPVITFWRLFDSSPTLVRTLVLTLRPIPRLFLLSVLFRDCSFCLFCSETVTSVHSLSPRSTPSHRSEPKLLAEEKADESLLLIALLKVTKPWTNPQIWTFQWNIPTRLFLSAHCKISMFLPVWQWVCDFFMFFLLNRKFHWVHCLLYMIGAPSLASRILNKITWKITLVAGAWSETHEMYHGGFFFEIGTY